MNMKYKILLVISVAVAAFFLISSCNNSEALADGSAVPETVSYNFNIRPISSDKCFKCHGPDASKRQAHLRLDIADSAFAALTETKGAFALVAGNPDQSELYKRVSSTDTSFIMPPPDSHLSALSPFEIKLIKKWIEQGAKYEKHWAFVAPQKATLPEIDHKNWVKNEIDHFILHKMERKE